MSVKTHVFQVFNVWYNKDGGAGDPLVAGKTAIPVVVATGNTNAQVATATAAAIDNLAAFVCPVPGAAVITITNAVQGTAVDVADGNNVG